MKNAETKTFELIINKSRFIAYKLDLTSLDVVKPFLEQLKKEHKKANHVCFAYVYHQDVVSEKCSDDGEPGGTAGYPILNVIKKKNLTNVLVAVVRYFGGIKLGAGGLTRAYTKASAGVLND
ncbi:MAG: YigZ family protein [Clostridia bacterium]|nr:YigZ family protein [Clostridia bacterium]